MVKLFNRKLKHTNCVTETNHQLLVWIDFFFFFNLYLESDHVAFGDYHFLNHVIFKMKPFESNLIKYLVKKKIGIAVSL